jgi:ATP-dependent DNA helicase RecQ
MSATTKPTTRVALQPAEPAANPTVLDAIRRYWGFDQLRPLQAEAIDVALAGRDSLVVLPTGGGKSLCYQVPPAVSGGTDIVISPLISLMKDQVDGLVECGYPAAALYTGLDASRRREIERNLLDGKYRLLFVAPERAISPWFLETAKKLGARFSTRISANGAAAPEFS